MVPQHKPKATYEFLRRWLKDEPWQGVNTYYEGVDDDIVSSDKNSALVTNY